ncbi:MAG TPA: hypothetical protein VGU61_12735 [Noviherbaspirillum sp.]|jgi:hypothetical protein|uniref:hypothetical protein n=1 Tax=Noviherbaspirillum sp. TaxID=1926288 RepID=UPI002DDD7EB5|nr:hypothetical protein [Noviherbaspirillum sp.]HEV2611128.1 hypothetical protein [Noviherbaspirillum sp.]
MPTFRLLPLAGYSYHELLSFLADHGYAIYRFHKNQLCPCTNDVIQEIVYADYLATIKSPDEIQQRSAWSIATMTDQELIDSIVEQDHHKEVQKAYELANKQRLPAFALDDARIPALLDKWNPLMTKPCFFALQAGSTPQSV